MTREGKKWEKQKDRQSLKNKRLITQDGIWPFHKERYSVLIQISRCMDLIYVLCLLSLLRAFILLLFLKTSATKDVIWISIGTDSGEFKRSTRCKYTIIQFYYCFTLSSYIIDKKVWIWKSHKSDLQQKQIALHGYTIYMTPLWIFFELRHEM